MTPVGLQPTIPGSVGRCLIHWATGPPSLRDQPANQTSHAFSFSFEVPAPKASASGRGLPRGLPRGEACLEAGGFQQVRFTS